MFLEWWMIIILIVATHFWAEHRFKSGFLVGARRGAINNVIIMTHYLVKERFLNVGRNENNQAVFVPWNEEDLKYKPTEQDMDELIGIKTVDLEPKT